jgi:hypothetical protein
MAARGELEASAAAAATIFRTSPMAALAAMAA